MNRSPYAETWDQNDLLDITDDLHEFLNDRRAYGSPNID
jgi:hypothetical protein